MELKRIVRVWIKEEAMKRHQKIKWDKTKTHKPE